jgi:hypothetical protein
MPRVISVSSQKGGVGKTTMAANLGVAWSEQGQRVLLVDLDPQFALTLAVRRHTPGGAGYDVRAPGRPGRSDRRGGAGRPAPRSPRWSAVGTHRAMQAPDPLANLGVQKPSPTPR